MMASLDKLVSVIIPVYNCDKYIYNSLTSIINQTYKNIEIIVIDDGSFDNTSNILKKFNNNLRIFKNEINLGIVTSLNIGLKKANGSYIARMDADDIAYPDRIEQQVSFLENNLEVGLCGTNAKIFGDNIKSKYTKNKLYHDDIICSLIAFPPIIHPTYMFRSSLLDDNDLFYDNNYELAEDYDILDKFSHKTKLANINSCGILYRIHNDKLSVTKSLKQEEQKNKIRRRILSRLTDFTENEFIIHNAAMDVESKITYSTLCKIEIWFMKLIKSNQEKKIYNSFCFNSFLKDKWLNCCNRVCELGKLTMFKYKSSFFKTPLFFNSKVFKFYIKRIIGYKYKEKK